MKRPFLKPKEKGGGRVYGKLLKAETVKLPREKLTRLTGGRKSINDFFPSSLLLDERFMREEKSLFLIFHSVALLTAQRSDEN